MNFHIFNAKGKAYLTDEAGQGLEMESESAAIDMAVRIAQDNDAFYKINYWNPAP